MITRALLLLALLAPVPCLAQLEGAIDVHIHSAPDSRPRSVTAIEAASMARRYGMRAIVLKNHFTETASLAYVVSQVVPGIEVYGGISLDRTVGGVNPSAVENMANMTGRLGRIVWMPTFDSVHDLLSDTPAADRVAVSRNGELLPEVLRVLEIIKQYDLTLATGHSGPEDSLLLIRAAKAAGIERIVVTHPASPRIEMSIPMQNEAAGLGALLEYPIALGLADGELPFDEFVADIRAVGPEHVVLSTDLGQPLRPTPADGFAGMLGRLAAAGFTHAELDVMSKQNPASLLGLEVKRR
jgi:Family of unknown function (DUF6282)